MVRLRSTIAITLASFAVTNAQSERECLTRFFGVTAGPYWFNNSRWNTDSPVCSWYGVECSNGTTVADSGVVSIDLQNNNLAGRVAKLIYFLPSLQNLTLNGNQLTDGGFEGFNESSTVSRLTVLQFADNSLTHVKGIGNAKALTELHLSENRLKGPFPEEIFQLTNLKNLLLTSNALTGTLPTSIGKLTMLENFYSLGNIFTGQIPSEIGMLSHVEVFTLAENAFHGTLPIQVNNMIALRTFSIHNNENAQGLLTGPLRAFDVSPFLDELYLDGNDLTGTVPDNFLRNSNDTDKVISIGLSNNRLNGTLPSSLSRFSSLFIDITGNEIQAISPDLCKNIAWMGGLVELFGCNAILCDPGTYNDNGRQTSENMTCQTCETSVAGSPFYGSKQCSLVDHVLPEWEIVSMLYVELRGVEWANRTGWDVLDNLLKVTALEALDGSTLNYCKWFGITCNTQNLVEEINLSNNGLTGQIPPLIFELPALKRLDLSRNAVAPNSITGFSSIAHAKVLEYVNFAGAKLGNLNQLSLGLSLKQLVLEGIDLDIKSFPDEIFGLINLESLQMPFTYMTGTFPSEIGLLTKLTDLNLYNNDLNGNIPTELGLLINLRTLDISENAFVGTLPTQVSDLVKLEKFHVHQFFGNLEGTLPAFDKFTNLIEFSIDSNQISGSIPATFLEGVANKSQHMKIGLSFNKLTGIIPPELAAFLDVDIELEGNQITEVAQELCKKSMWMNGEVGLLQSCNAILCPSNTWNLYGRASARAASKCQTCNGNEYMGSTVCAQNLTMNQEKEILDNLYISTGGSYWKSSKNWTEPGVPICQREGVICEVNQWGDSGVSELRLNGYGLQGLIPSEIFQLPYIRLLGFTNNDVDLTFTDFANATKLQTLEMSNTSIKSLVGIGSAPAKLTEIHIANNQMTGTIPDEFFSLKGVTTIYAESNLFTGSIPSAISGMSSLQKLFLSNNDITGQLPTELTLLTSLIQLDLQGNKISGVLPTGIDFLVNLQRLMLGAQDGTKKMTGPLFNFKNNTELTELDLSGNAFQGTIPIDFLAGVARNASIKVLLSNNQLEGEIPSNLVEFSSLFIDLSGNKITNVTGVCNSSTNIAGWMEGNVGSLGCDALLCPPATALKSGRQVSASAKCSQCPNGTAEAPYFGSTHCVSQSTSFEQSVLMTLFELLNGTNWNDNTNWISDTSVCKWFGIVCDVAGSVVEINLAQNNLEATSISDVSKLFFSLPYLKTIDLTGNDVPLDLKEISVLSMLQVLQLSATGLQSIEGLEMATDLRRLHVTSNFLNGTIPDLIFALTNLRSLFLSFNEFSGTLPANISSLSHLEEFYAYGNSLNGPLPGDALSKLTNIKDFVMSENSLTGQFPSQFSSLPKLEQLSLFDQHGDTHLSGSIPNFSGAPNLWYFDVTGNDMSGTIPSDFMQNSFFKNDSVTIYLGKNSLTGTVPSSLDAFSMLDLLIVGNLISEVPNVFCDNTDWMQGDVGIVGTCAAIACLPGTWSAEGRQSTMEQPCDVCSHVATAALWGQMSCKDVSPEKEVLFKLYRNTGGANWNFKDNWNSEKPICSWEGIICDGGTLDDIGVADVTGISLSFNNLVGTLPSEVYTLPMLKSMEVSFNSDLIVTFDGLENAKKLELLDLSGTWVDNLNGISNAENLVELHISNCGLTGPLPSELFDLSSTLKALYMNGNFFSGSISPAVGGLTSLTDFYALDNDFSGTIPSEVGLMTSLENMVLSENLISGSIPSHFSSLDALQVLSVYRRTKPGPRLSGPLPAFDYVPNLRGLYLDGNDLTGEIPASFLNASAQASINVFLAHNQLSGVVPAGINDLPGLNIHLEGNKITGFPSVFCNQTNWMNGQIARAGCDAFLCPVGKANVIGRANQSLACSACVSDAQAPYFGSTSCRDGTERSLLVNLYQQCGGRDWYRHDGWTTDEPVCNWYGINCNTKKSVESIDLGNNNLQGTVHSEIFELTNLKSLWLHSNPIHVSFESIGSAKRLTDIRLDATMVADLKNLDRAEFLTILDLRFTQLQGPFPEELLSLTNLRSLNLGNNKLNGPLPESFAALRFLRVLRLGANQFTGKIPAFHDLNVLDTLDISNNALTGQIPSNFLSLITTTADLEVDLASNVLTGTIPVELDRFDRVTIYLRENNIVGLSSSFCDNVGWNSGDVESYGCNGILCPPGTFNSFGRARGASVCLQCNSDNTYYGQVECNPSSTASPLMAWSLGAIAFLVCLYCM